MVPDPMRVQREGAQLQARGMWSVGQDDDKERFLADLRALRDTAALGYDELAARAHYPSVVLKEAENGPSLPGLPILAAYVRACDADVLEWEERWRRLGYAPDADPGLPVRPAGTSPAAAAGARASVSIAPPDMYDPERIRAALRSQRVHADQIAVQSTTHLETTTAGLARTGPDAEGVGTQAVTAAESPAGWGGSARGDGNAGTGTAAGWGTDTSRDAGPVWNTGTSWDAGSAWRTGTSRDGAADSSSASANGNHHAGPHGPGLFDAPVTETPGYPGGPRDIRHDPFSGSWLQDSELTAPAPGAGSGRKENGPAPAERTDFWAPAAATKAGPGPAVPPVEEGSSLPQGAHGAGSAVPAQSQATAKPAVQQMTAATPSEHHRDRLFPLRLLAVIVVAALIGSILVLVIR
jgi:hypothetical protein